MNTFIVKVSAFWDSEVNVWVASSDNLPGLVTEASTIEMLTAKLKAMIPELIELNRVESDNKDYIDLYLTTHRHESIKMAG
ncbi:MULTISPECIES: DUF1902 domain-containing protein [unclassified Nostoc]|uniref:DUF1902 domain-containing protein n=1 Tax=unclassified Nostoc TaxID=2593658 RepID=UPI002AD47116|nr:MULTISPECIES: DUF1902 domain-containing protein [unclassified Nostoc]MDZ8035359.1 DUF1902 domain-containing protein [Nostoc sp. DedSLP04]MDZ8130500.1 DUF1902 domain-containing protein [Nostoc sp. DedQUE07]